MIGSRGRDRPSVTWTARLDGDMKDMRLRPGMAMDRKKWSCGIMGKRLTRISVGIMGVVKLVVVGLVVVHLLLKILVI